MHIWRFTTLRAEGAEQRGASRADSVAGAVTVAAVTTVLAPPLLAALLRLGRCRVDDDASLLPVCQLRESR